MNPDKPLTQRDFIQRLKDDLEFPIGPATVHRFMGRGMPTIQKGIRKLFHYPSCRAWILASRDLDPVELATRDRLYKRQLRRTG